MGVSERNQCDGCMAGIPVDEHGHHRAPYPSGGMVCEAHRYGHSPVREVAGAFVDGFGEPFRILLDIVRMRSRRK